MMIAKCAMENFREGINGKSKIMLSPCMVCENEEIYDWMLLNDTLDFIDRYLECGLDSIEGSIFIRIRGIYRQLLN